MILVVPPFGSSRSDQRRDVCNVNVDVTLALVLNRHSDHRPGTPLLEVAYLQNSIGDGGSLYSCGPRQVMMTMTASSTA